jgi:hypothetical protein
MSKKYRRGQRKSEIQPNELGSKRKLAGKRLNKVGPMKVGFKNYTEYLCAVCGRTITTPYIGLDGKTRCMICTLEAM